MTDFAFRLSPAPSVADLSVEYAGAVKLRLAHAPGRSYLIPELLLVEFGRHWSFFIPSFFGPNVIAFEHGTAVSCELALDVVRPGTNRGIRLHLHIDPADLRRRHTGGGHLYGCTVRGPSQLRSAAGGRARVSAEGDVLLEVFHFTDVKGQVGIRRSGALNSTQWNLAGLQRLKNVAYGYCTTLPRLRGRSDLARIAMATDGRLAFRTTSRAGEPERVFEMSVYRQSTQGRTHRLTFWAPAEALSPPHLLWHHPFGEQAYYETVGPEIVRLGVHPKLSIAVGDDGVMAVPSQNIRSFDYIVEGDASTKEGVLAPYREEETKSVAHLERLEGDDPFSFWWRQQNQNLANREVADPRRLVPRLSA